MAWIESHQTLRSHPKVARLAATLRVTKAQAIGHLHLLWWWSLDYAPDGNLSPFTELEIATAAEWTRDAGKFVAALLDSKLLDSLLS